MNDWLTRSGSLPLDRLVDPTTLLSHFADCLWAASASTVEIQGNRVAFTRGILSLMGRWNVLAPFDWGELTVDAEAHEVRYSVSIRQLVQFGTILVGLMAVFLLASRSPQPLWLLTLMWLCLVGGNLAIGLFRFKSFVARAIKTAPIAARTSSSS